MIHKLDPASCYRNWRRCELYYFGARKKMRTYRKILVLVTLLSMCFAVATASENEGAVKKTKKHPKTEQMEAKPACEACEAIKRLEDKIAAQQAEIDALKAAQQPAAAPAPPTDEEARAAAAEAKRKADEAAAAAAEANAKAAAAASQNEALQKGLEEAKTSAQNAEKKVAEFEAPAYIHYKNVKLTPGGYLALEGVWRQRADSADTYTDFNKLPFRGDSRYDMTEFRASARASRASLLVEGAVKNTKLSGYFEMDFEGAAPTANENQTSSFNPRLRQAFGQASWHTWTVNGGSSWSLITLNQSGIKTRNEWIPSTIDGNYLPGYTYARLANLRIAKTLAEGRATAAFSIENPATLVAGTVPATAITSGPGNGQLNNGGGTCTTTADTSTETAATCTIAGSNFTTNLAPDLMAKIAFDPSFAHIEVKAVGRFFRDRVIGVDNHMVVDGGFGAGILVPVMHKKVVLIADALAGRGIGRYGVGGNQASADITIFSDGSIHPLKELHGVAGAEIHVTPKLDWYLYGGEDYIGRDFDATSATVGYGNPSRSVGVCEAPDTGFNATSACTANTKSLIQGTTGFWYNIYKGGYGTLRYGTQYSWTYKSTWRGVNALNPANDAPHTTDNIVFTSLRYVIP